MQDQHGSGQAQHRDEVGKPGEGEDHKAHMDLHPAYQREFELAQGPSHNTWEAQRSPSTEPQGGVNPSGKAGIQVVLLPNVTAAQLERGCNTGHSAADQNFETRERVRQKAIMVSNDCKRQRVDHGTGGHPVSMMSLPDHCPHDRRKELAEQKVVRQPNRKRGKAPRDVEGNSHCGTCDALPDLYHDFGPDLLHPCPLTPTSERENLCPSCGGNLSVKGGEFCEECICIVCGSKRQFGGSPGKWWLRSELGCACTWGGFEFCTPPETDGLDPDSNLAWHEWTENDCDDLDALLVDVISSV